MLNKNSKKPALSTVVELKLKGPKRCFVEKYLTAAAAAAAAGRLLKQHISPTWARAGRDGVGWRSKTISVQDDRDVYNHRHPVSTTTRHHCWGPGYKACDPHLNMNLDHGGAFWKKHVHDSEIRDQVNIYLYLYLSIFQKVWKLYKISIFDS